MFGIGGIVPSTIEVTPEDIANGQRQQPDACPLAIAMKRAFSFTSCSVHNGVVNYVDAHGDAGKMDVGEALANEIAAYDKGGEMKPFTMTLGIVGLGEDVPDEYPATRP